jgi:crossover junction endodeoxyribonuclease RusA
MVESSKKVKPWRQAVEYAALEAHPFGSRIDPILIRGPVAVGIVFSMPRPKSAKKGAAPDKKPDIDKLCRSTLDSLVTSGMIEDDARVVALSAAKLYAGHRKGLPVPGAIVSIEHASQD